MAMVPGAVDILRSGITVENAASLEPGKLADMIVLAQDPFKIPEDALKDVKVDATIVGRRVVHE